MCVPCTRLIDKIFTVSSHLASLTLISATVLSTHSERQFKLSEAFVLHFPILLLFIANPFECIIQVSDRQWFSQNPSPSSHVTSWKPPFLRVTGVEDYLENTLQCMGNGEKTGYKYLQMHIVCFSFLFNLVTFEAWVMIFKCLRLAVIFVPKSRTNFLFGQLSISGQFWTRVTLYLTT